MDSMIQPMRMDDLSDRTVLTVRICSDGNREWLDSSGRIALIFCEKSQWWARESNQHPRVLCHSEIEAFDSLLKNRLAEIRAEAHRKALARIKEMEEEG